MVDLYGTGIEIWAGFWPIGSTEKKGLGVFFMFSWAKNMGIPKVPKCSKNFQKVNKPVQEI